MNRNFNRIAHIGLVFLGLANLLMRDVGEVRDEVSDYYHRVLREAIKAVTSMIEPLMIVIMGSVVGFIAMAIILPIFKMSSLVSG